jgi:hypothetical protein
LDLNALRTTFAVGMRWIAELQAGSAQALITGHAIRHLAAELVFTHAAGGDTCQSI